MLNAVKRRGATGAAGNFSWEFEKMRMTISKGASPALAAALLLLLAAACGPRDGSTTGGNSARQSPTAAANSNAGPARPAANAPAEAAPPDDGVRRVTIAEARAAAERGNAVIFDVRNQQSYDVSHVKGSKLVPYDAVAQHLSEFPKDKLIITYCA